jgi:CMP-N-acetylneuraminic acid synthetase
VKKLKLLGLLPARGGSKGVPGKNIKALAGVPLIAWSIRAARDSGAFERIVVTTDSPEIAAVASSFGAPVPWLRPAELAGDRSPSIDFVLHALDRLMADDGWEPDAVMLLQPTSPFRSAASIRRAAEAFAASGTDSMASVSPVSTHPWSCYFLDAGGRLERAAPGAPEVLRRQDLPPAYAPDGSIYVTSPRFLRQKRGFLGPGTVAFLTPPDEAADIDTADDWARAEAFARGRTQTA